MSYFKNVLATSKETASNLDKVFTLTGMNNIDGYNKAMLNIEKRVKVIFKDLGISKIRVEGEYDDPKTEVIYYFEFSGWSLNKLNNKEITNPLKEEFKVLKPSIFVLSSFKDNKGYTYKVSLNFKIKTISETRK